MDRLAEKGAQPGERAPGWSPATAAACEEFTPLATLYQDGRTTLLRAVRRDRGSVVLKVLDPQRCREKDLERLRREYEMGASLDLDCAVRPYGLDTYEGMPALVLEDFGGEPLERLAMPMPVERFLDLALRIAVAVAEVHARGVVHKDLKPANILVNASTSRVKIADFGIATRLRREQQPARPPQLIEGSLPYMSPEQTGRMNCALDSRSDLYSLGVTFYQMLTGRLPFEARDPLEWIHCHVARAPVPPSRLVPEVPEALDRIVTKLLAKMVEDRYQTARGLEHDLGQCLEQWRRSGRIQPFTLGVRDVPDRLLIPQKLYGREEQVAALLRAFERVVERGSPELVLVSGYSGIGKSSLVHELQKPIVGRRGLFAAGKFDPYNRDVPYSTIAQAFRELVLALLVEGEERIALWRQRLQAALGVNGQLILDVIPQVELLVGKQPPVPALPLSDAKNRFHLTFRRFLGAFAREEYPLTLFLDDLQWADAASLELLANVLTHPETQRLLAIGAYRDNEVTAGHPLMMALDGVRQSGLAVHEIVLAPLSREDLGRFVADTMRRSVDDVEPLVTLIEEKTAGNPYFAIQFLSSLEEDGLLRLDPADLAWRCDIASASARGYTDNVVDLMVAKLRRLSPEAQEAAKLAACGGNVIDTATFSALRALSEEKTHRDLGELVCEGLLFRSGDTYRFSHDRVREAAYALIPEDERPRRHLTLGRLLLAHTPAEQLGERVFDIVNQLNRGAALIEEPAERWRLAELDLLAGRRAKAGAAYGAAREVLAAGMAMLSDDAWQARHELTRDLHFERAQCEYVQGDFAEAERCISQAMLHAKSRAEKAAGHHLRIEVRHFRGENEKAVESLLECAALFGLTLERHPTAELVQERYQELRHALRGRSIEGLLDRPPLSDPDLRALLDVLTIGAMAAWVFDTRLNFLTVIECARLSVEHGDAPGSGATYAALGALIGPLFGEYRDGYRFGKLGRDLVEGPEFVASRAETWMVFCSCCAFWGQHVGATLPLLEEALRLARETGRLSIASSCAFFIAAVPLARGEALAVVERRSEQMLDFVRKARDGRIEDNILPLRRLVRRLRGRASSPASAGGRPAEDEGLDERIQGYPPLVVCAFYVRSLQERFLFGEYREALSAAAPVKSFPVAFWTLFESCEYSFFLALTLAALHAEVPAREQEEHLRELRGEVERHRVWAEVCPENFLNRFALVSAELARVEGRELDAERFYEDAIRSARENGFVQNEALAYELASNFYRARGYEQIADLYLRDARACYARWGADGKVRQLEQLHPQLVGQRPLAPTSTFAVQSEQLDLLAVVKASQTISEKVEVEELVGTLLEVALEQGGACKGYLVLERDGRLFIEAEAILEEHGVATRVLPSLAVESSPLLPVSVIQFARLTREPVILADAASQPGKFASDPYLSRQGQRSVLCLPIPRQAGLVGLLYLENTLVAGAFTRDRLTALSILASQAAISLENALLLARERAARGAAEEARRAAEQARAATEEAERRSAFLAEAGALLSESLDYEETLSRLGRLCVASLADTCILDLVEGREIRRVAGACADPAKEPLLERLRQRYPARWNSPHPAARTLGSGEPLLVPEITDGFLRDHCEDEEHAQLVRAIGIRSALVAPLVAGGKTLGVLTLGSDTPGRYGPADLALAQEVARRAASAIDNSRLYREIQQADQRKSEFIAVLSHELRNPLAPIRTGLQLVRRSPPGSPIASRAWEIMARQTEHMSHLLDDLLDITRISHGKIELHRARLDLRDVVRSACEDSHSLFERGTLTLRLDLPPGPVWIEADMTRLSQVVGNLLQNAAKFTPAGGDVTVAFTAGGGCAEVSVRDTGVGMEPGEVERMFEPFAQAEQGLARTQGGLGLGLALAKGLVELHGGSIRARSEGRGRGSEFVVTLPLSGEPPPT